MRTIFISSILIALVLPILQSFTEQKNNILEAEFIIEVNSSMRKMLGFIDIILIPTGILAALAFTFFLVDTKTDVVNTIASGMTFILAIVFHSMRLSVVKKKILVTEDRLKVVTAWKKEKDINIENISYAKIVQQTIILYDLSNKKLVTLTALYNGYSVLIKWLEIKGIEIRNS